jgi:hypothetical protein
MTDNAFSSTNSSANNSTTSNVAPSISSVSPTNGSTNQQLYTSCNATVTDPEGDTMTVYFYYQNSTDVWVLQQTNSSVSNNSNVIWANFSNASSYSTLYNWSINVTDSTDWTNGTYNFTTISNCRPIAPSGMSATGTSASSISLSWTKGSKADTTRIQRKTSGYPTSISDGSNAYNGTASTTIDSPLSEATTYYYRAWSWNSTGSLWSLTSITASGTTQSSGGSPPAPPPPSDDDDDTTDDDDDDTTDDDDDTVDDTQTQTSEDTMNEVSTDYDVELEEPFYATDTDEDGEVDTFTDPNEELTAVDKVDIDDKTAFLISTDDDEIPEFFWDTTDDTVTSITHTPTTPTDTTLDEDEETITITVDIDKSGWIYIDVDDDYPNYDVVVQTSDGTTISSDRIWREGGKIYVLDDPATEYLFVYSYTILAPIFTPTSGNIFNTSTPEITITYSEEVEITSATLETLDVLSLITTTDNLNFTYAPEQDLENGAYTLQITAEDSDDNTLTSSASYTIQAPVTPTPTEDETPWLLILLVIIVLMILIIGFLFKSGYLYIEEMPEKKKPGKKKKK